LSPAATGQPDKGMVDYFNADYGYQLRVPPAASIIPIGVQGFPSADLPAGMNPTDYLAQLSEQYPEGLCLQIHYRSGYIYISAAANREYRYAICGRTGVGAGEMIPKREELQVAGGLYIAEGFEYLALQEMGGGLVDHNETMVLMLSDGTRIEYGARPDAAVTYAHYLAEVRPALLQIVASYEDRPGS
jgi:hypothetical protein